MINPYAKDYPASDAGYGGRDSGYGGRPDSLRSRTESPATKQPFKWDKWVSISSYVDSQLLCAALYNVFVVAFQYSPYGSRDSVNDDRGSQKEPFNWMKSPNPAYSAFKKDPVSCLA